MRLPALAFAASLLTVPVFAQVPAEEELKPEELMKELGDAPDPDEMNAAIAAANAYPLGSKDNPVRVGGPEGAHAYIARLRCADGSLPRGGPRGAEGVGVFGSIVDGYPLDCAGAAPGKVLLIMDMYHEEHAEDRAPPGFTITPRQ